MINDKLFIFNILIYRVTDFFNIMAYDFHGSWEATTGHNAPLFKSDDEVYPSSTYNVVRVEKYYHYAYCITVLVISKNVACAIGCAPSNQTIKY